MHFPSPSRHRSKSASSSSSKRSTRSGHEESPRAKEASLEREGMTRAQEEEEEVTEWIEGQDIVIERRSCIPGEDVQVEVLRGAAAHLNGHGQPKELEEVKKVKEVMRRRGRKKEKEKEGAGVIGGGVIGKCREVFQMHNNGAGGGRMRLGHGTNAATDHDQPQH